MYYICIVLHFKPFVFGAKEYEFTIFKTENKDYAIDKAKEFNNDLLLDITFCHFKVYFSETKTYNKKKTKIVYP